MRLNLTSLLLSRQWFSGYIFQNLSQLSVMPVTQGSADMFFSPLTLYQDAHQFSESRARYFDKWAKSAPLKGTKSSYSCTGLLPDFCLFSSGKVTEYMAEVSRSHLFSVWIALRGLDKCWDLCLRVTKQQFIKRELFYWSWQLPVWYIVSPVITSLRITDLGLCPVSCNIVTVPSFRGGWSLVQLYRLSLVLNQTLPGQH